MDYISNSTNSSILQVSYTYIHVMPAYAYSLSLCQHITVYDIVFAIILCLYTHVSIYAASVE